MSSLDAIQEDIPARSLQIDMNMNDLFDEFALEEIIEEKKRRFRVKRHALPPMDLRKDYHK